MRMPPRSYLVCDFETTELHPVRSPTQAVSAAHNFGAGPKVPFEDSHEP